MQHFLGIQHLSKSELDELLDLAAKFKAKKKKADLKGKTLVTMFFNPSTRTKTSFDIAMMQLGGHTVCLEPGKSSWGMEIKEGAVMDGDAEEHLKEATICAMPALFRAATQTRWRSVASPSFRTGARISRTSYSTTWPSGPTSPSSTWRP